jgi:hypothetical protein
VNFHPGFVAALCSGFIASASYAGVSFSFGSDSNPDGPTFAGTGLPAGSSNQLLDGSAFDSSGATEVGLIVDVNGNQPGGGSLFNSIFDFTGVTSSYSASAFAGGFLHSWSVSGSFTFTETGSGLEVLQIDFTNAVFTSFSASSSTLGSSATLQTSDDLDAALLFTPGAPLLGLGVTAAALASDESFSFSLSGLQASNGSGAPLALSAGGHWNQSWLSEGSFSASASPVPGPAGLALLGIAAIMGRRARRRA